MYTPYIFCRANNMFTKTYILVGTYNYMIQNKYFVLSFSKFILKITHLNSFGSKLEYFILA